jgi:AcrR family transcriptional regulator
VRAATIEEIKQTALRLMREHRTTDVRFSDIARAMGMTPPALYRYFGDRDELLSALIADAFVDAAARGQLHEPLLHHVDEAIRRCAAGKDAGIDDATDANDATGVEIPADTFQAMMHAWSALHGFTCLETFGHLEWMEPDAREALFVGQVRLAARAAGLPADEA